MKQLVYMCGCYDKPKLTERDFFPPRSCNDFLVLVTKNSVIRKNTFLAFLFLFFIIPVFAQQKISGVVTTLTGSPLSGATIIVKGSNTSTSTNADGSFVIWANKNDVLLISYVGYNPGQIIAGNGADLKISLTPSVIDLDQVIVTGYTSQKLKEIVGSVAVVRPKELVSVPAGQVEQMLQGRVAGLTVITSGEPGVPSQIYLHGPGNFGNVTPLYIIDGVEGNINSLNPYDIESIQVLKDAAAYSIYGVRGANGVILVTTKNLVVGSRVGK